MYPHTLLWRARKFFRFQNAWTTDYHDFQQVLRTRGGEAFAESLDRSRSNLMVALFNRVAPEQKKIIVDHRDESIFRDLYNTQGEKIVAVVNQWHVEGI
jgi:pheromone shutdown protein TraB